MGRMIQEKDLIVRPWSAVFVLKISSFSFVACFPLFPLVLFSFRPFLAASLLPIRLHKASSVNQNEKRHGLDDENKKCVYLLTEIVR